MKSLIHCTHFKIAGFFFYEKQFVCFAVLDEIEERRQFLADMASLGQEQQYINLINSEISQVIKKKKTGLQMCFIHLCLVL